MQASRRNESGESGGRIRSSVFLAGPAGCAHVRIAYGCAVALFGAMTASSDGVAAHREGSAGYAAAGGRLGVAIPIAQPWLELRLQADLLATLTRHTLALDGTDVYRFPPVSGALALAPILWF